MHIRKTIRNVAEQALLSHLDVPVYTSRVYPLAAEDLPAVLVFCQAEDVDTRSMSRPRAQERHCQLVVECYSAAVEEMEDELDGMSEKVEVALMNGVFDATTRDIRLTRTELFSSDKAETPLGCARLIFDLVYYTKETNPTATT